jgi:hypothetical protein
MNRFILNRINFEMYPHEKEEINKMKDNFYGCDIDWISNWKFDWIVCSSVNNCSVQYIEQYGENLISHK